MLIPLEMPRTSSLPFLSGPLWLIVVAPDTILFMGQIELFDIHAEGKEMAYDKLDCLQ